MSAYHGAALYAGLWDRETVIAANPVRLRVIFDRPSRFAFRLAPKADLPWASSPFKT
jgi:hypothetical protein